MTFNFINGQLATGSAINTEDDVRALLAVGVTHILNCAEEVLDLPLILPHKHLTYCKDGTLDDGYHPKPVSWFKKGLDFALPALKEQKNKLYSHCAAGRNRGPSMAYCILRAYTHISAADAEAMIRKVRPEVTLAYIRDADLALKALGYIT